MIEPQPPVPGWRYTFSFQVPLTGRFSLRERMQIERAITTPWRPWRINRSHYNFYTIAEVQAGPRLVRGAVGLWDRVRLEGPDARETADGILNQVIGNLDDDVVGRIVADIHVIPRLGGEEEIRVATEGAGSRAGVEPPRLPVPGWRYTFSFTVPLRGRWSRRDQERLARAISSPWQVTRRTPCSAFYAISEVEFVPERRLAMGTVGLWSRDRFAASFAREVADSVVHEAVYATDDDLLGRLIGEIHTVPRLGGEEEVR